MKFRDPETGKVFKNIMRAIDNFRCPGPCVPEGCPLALKVGGPSGCHSGVWWAFYPAEAARLMGYEAIDDSSAEIDEAPDAPTVSGDTPTEEDDMDKQEKAEPLAPTIGGKGMKYRDPETGKVFRDIETAMEYFCCGSLRQCDNCNFYNKNCGKNWVHDHPAEAAHLMGYEVIDDSPAEIDDTPTKEDNMDKQDKPLSEWTLGEVKAECAAHKNGCCDCKLCNSSFCASPNGNPAEWVLTP